MRKTISLLLVCAIFLAGFRFPAGAAAAVENAEVEFGLLTALEIFTEQTQADRNAVVTREDFALYLARALNIDEFQRSDTRYFKDVDMDSYGTNAIYALVQRGILSVDGDRLFRPDDGVTAVEACKMMLYALGYEPYVQVKGGYPNGTLFAAKEAGLLKGVDPSGKVTTAAAAKLLYNGLTAKTYVMNTISTQGAAYEAAGKDLLEIYHQISKIEGTVTGAWGVSLTGAPAPCRGELYIDNALVKTNQQQSYDHFLGSYVTAFYQQPTATADKTLVYLAKCAKNADVQIATRDFIAYTTDSVSYYNGGKKTSKSIDETTRIVYNGAFLDREVAETFRSLRKGSLTFKDSDNDGRYDVIIVKDYATLVVNHTDESTETIYDRLDYGNYLRLTDWETVRMVNTDGMEQAFSKIPKFAVLSVAQSKDKRVLEIIVSAARTEGEIEEIFYENGSWYLAVGSEKIGLDGHYKGADGFAPGKRYALYLDAFGEVAFYEVLKANGMKYGYLVNCAMKSGVDNQLLLKLYTENNTLAVLECAQKLRIDGISISSAEQAVLAIPGVSLKDGSITNMERQVIRYQTDASERIKEIDTYYYNADAEDPSDTLTKALSFRDNQYYNGGRFGLTTLVTGSTMVFKTPGDAEAATADEMEFVCTDMSSGGFIEGKEYGVEAYRLRQDADFAEIIVNKTQQVGILDRPMLVSRVYDKMTEDGFTVKAVDGLLSGKSVSYYAENEALLSGIASGDAVRCAVNAKNEIVRLEQVYDYSTGELPNWTGIDDTVTLYVKNYTQSFQMSFGYLAQKGERTAAWGFKTGANIDEAFELAKIPIMVYDESKKQNQAYVGTLDDIQDYRTVGASCSKILFVSVYNNGALAIIYK